MVRISTDGRQRGCRTGNPFRDGAATSHRTDSADGGGGNVREIGNTVWGDHKQFCQKTNNGLRDDRRDVCRELRREPAWVGAIRVAFTQGPVTADAVIKEASPLPECYRTVEDVLSTVAKRDLLEEAPDFESSERYNVGGVLRRAAPKAGDVGSLSMRAVHRWG
jgi:hypothetical protein